MYEIKIKLLELNIDDGPIVEFVASADKSFIKSYLHIHSDFFNFFKQFNKFDTINAMLNQK